MHPDTRVLNVRSPWAELIINGWKDVENRPNALKMHPNAVCLLLNSANKSSRADIRRTNCILKAIGKDPVWKPTDRPQCIIGVVKFEGSFDEDEFAKANFESPWYNGAPDRAWVVKEYWKLPNPIPNVPGSLSLRKLHNLKRSHPELYDLILKQLEAQLG